MHYEGCYGLGACLVGGTAWWIIGSALLWYTWSKVCVPVFGAKGMKLFQALLLVATACFLINVPRYFVGRALKHCGQHAGGCCHDKAKGHDRLLENAAPETK